MLYKSLNKISKKVNFETAVKKGLADDGGLYFPENIKPLSNNFYQKITEKSNHQIAFEVINQFIGDSIDKNNIDKIIKNTLTFDFPLIKIEKIFSRTGNVLTSLSDINRIINSKLIENPNSDLKIAKDLIEKSNLQASLLNEEVLDLRVFPMSDVMRRVKRSGCCCIN